MAQSLSTFGLMAMENDLVSLSGTQKRMLSRSGTTQPGVDIYVLANGEECEI